MNEMSDGELAVKLAEENRTRKILAIAKEAEDKEAIIKMLEMMLNDQ